MPRLILQFEDRVLKECSIGLMVTIGRLPDNTVMIWRCVNPPILPESAGAALVAESAMCLPLSPELLFVTSHQSRQLTLVVRGKTCEKFGELLALFRRPVRDNVGNGGIATLNAGLKERLALICSSKHRHPAVIRISPTSFTTMHRKLHALMVSIVKNTGCPQTRSRWRR